MPTRIAVLASGRGSNLEALLDHLASLGPARPADVVLAASDRGDAGALEHARLRGIDAVALDLVTRTDGLLSLLTARSVDLVVLAGYLRRVPAEVTRAFRGRMVNVHPALLPAFGGAGMYGVHVHEAVLSFGARVSGATVHFVDEEYDHGAIIAQWPVPVFPSDSPDALARRVLAVEHQLYPRAIAALASGHISLGEDGAVRLGAFRQLHTCFALRDDPGAAAEAMDAWWSHRPAADAAGA